MTRRWIARLAVASAVAVVGTLGLVVPGGGPDLTARGVTGGSQTVAAGVTGGSQSAVPK